MGTKYFDRWKHAQDVFKVATKTMTRWVPAAISPVNTIKKVDAAVDDAGKDQNHLHVFEQAVAAFINDKNIYVHDLDGSVTKVPQGHDHDAYVKGVTVLKTELTAMESTLKGAMGIAKSAVAQESVVEATAKNLITNAEGATHRALAFVAKAKTTPTAEYFNSNIVKAARDITQQIGNVDKLKQKGYQFHHDQPTTLFNILKAWANDGRVVHVSNPNNEHDEVIREIGAFEQAAQGVERWLKGEE
jgi:hypothetical protein